MKTQRGTRRFGWLLIAILSMLVYTGLTLIRPLPSVKPAYSPTINIKTGEPKLNWPATGQAALAVQGSDIRETSGTQKPSPMASTAKVVTALMILDKKPMPVGGPGETYTITQADVDIYNRYVSQDGSILPVKLGEKLTEYQMLQALMLPSANNIADTMAIWAYASLPDYSDAANLYLKSKGIKNTHIGSDASGLSPNTVTTAEDLVKIGELALKEPVLKEVFSQKTATGLPLVPVIKNVNFMIGLDGIFGIKTGNSDQAGGAFVGAAKTKIADKEVTFVTAVVAAPNLSSAMNSSRKLIQSAEKNFVTTSVNKKGSVVGTYTAPWGEKTNAVLAEDISTNSWQGEAVQENINLKEIKPGKTKAGVIVINPTVSSFKSTHPVKLSKPLSTPSIWWRLIHPLN